MGLTVNSGATITLPSTGLITAGANEKKGGATDRNDAAGRLLAGLVR